MPDNDAMPTDRARTEAAQILDGLARLMLIDDPAMTSPEYRRSDAYEFRRIARALHANSGSPDPLPENPGPGGELIRDSREWTAGLHFELQAGSGTPWQGFGWLDELT